MTLVWNSSLICAGFVRQKRKEADASFFLIKYGAFFPLFLFNEAGTGY
jgi:hypothetical protein